MNTSQKKNVVSASDLAQMGVCERRIRFEAQYGKRSSRERAETTRRGIREHEKFFQEGVRVNPKLDASVEKRWCFIASATFGPMAPETQTLRQFRDEILRKTVAGRAMVRTYYRVSPGICQMLMGKKATIVLVRMAMRPVVILAGAILKIRAKRSRD